MKLFHPLFLPLTRRACWLALLIVPLSLAAAPAAKSAPKVFRAGAARSNITPPLGTPVVGGFHPFPARHVHDELWAKCLVLDDGTTRLAIVVCDVLGMARQVYDEAARLVEQEVKLPRANLMMSATHTHSAGSALTENRYDLRAELNEYQRFVARRIADGVRRAIANLEPAQIGWGSGEEPDQVFNRRWFLKPGTMPVNPFGSAGDRVKMNPPRNSEILVKPAGPTDPQVMVLAVRSQAGRPLALLANYSLHYVGGVRGGDISADYFGMFCERMEDLLEAARQDPPFVAMLSNGTSGDINNINFRARAEPLPAYAKMRRVAEDVAQAAFGAVKGIRYRDDVVLRAAFRDLEVAVRRPAAAELQRARALVAGIQPSAKKSLEQIYAERTLGIAALPARLPLPLQAMRIGDVGIAAIPNEVFVEIGLELKRRGPFQPSFTHSLANGYYGYLPTPGQHEWGGYETWLGTNWFEPRTSVEIVDALLELWNGMR